MLDCLVINVLSSTSWWTSRQTWQEICRWEICWQNPATMLDQESSLGLWRRGRQWHSPSVGVPEVPMISVQHAITTIVWSTTLRSAARLELLGHITRLLWHMTPCKTLTAGSGRPWPAEFEEIHLGCLEHRSAGTSTRLDQTKLWKAHFFVSFWCSSCFFFDFDFFLLFTRLPPCVFAGADLGTAAPCITST